MTMTRRTVHRGDTLCPYCGKRWYDHPLADRHEAGFYCTGRSAIATAKKKQTPRRALFRVLDMAEEMDQGLSAELQREIELVRRWLGVKKGC